MKKQKIIIDADPGIDDSVAIAFFLSHPDAFDIKLISTISGNVNINQVTKNTLFLLKKFKRKIPVVMGANKPLIRKPIYAAEIHGKTGLGGYKADYKGCDVKKVKKDVVEEMYNTIKTNPGEIILVSLGPKTNIANLLNAHPDCASLIKKHICMGGSLLGKGNITEFGEFNCWVDPEAFEIVLQHNIPTIISPMEIGEQLIFGSETVEKISKINAVGEFFKEMFSEYKNEQGQISVQNHDPAVALYMLKPDIFKSFSCELIVDVGEKYRGKTIVAKMKGSNISILSNANIIKYEDYFLELVYSFGK